MALSFLDSKQLFESRCNYSVDDGNWIRSNLCKWYEQYDDDKYSTIDAKKTIVLNELQINLSQEENSQFIPFEMDRYYDGIDLSDKTIQIHYINAEQLEDYDNAVNVQYSTNKIRFGWLLNGNATYLAGNISFEIRVTGINELGENYLWISRPNNNLNIIASLSGNGIVQPDSNWYQGFVNIMNTKIVEAANYVSQAQAHTSSSQQSAREARQAAIDAQNTVSGFNETVNEKVNEVMESVNAEVAKQISIIENKTSEQVDVVVEEVTKQISVIENKASELVDVVMTEVKKQIDKISQIVVDNKTYIDEKFEESNKQVETVSSFV